MTSIYTQRLEQVISGVCADIKGELNLEDEDAEQAIWIPLKKALEASIEKNCNQHLKVLVQTGGAVAGSAPDASKHSKTVSTGKTSRTNGRIIAWNEWQADPKNDAKAKYKSDDGSEISAWDWWNKNVWKPLSDDEKKKYNNMAQAQNEKTKAASGSGEKKETRTKNAFQLFQAAHEHYYSDGDKFHEPESNQKVTGWSLTQKIWTKAIKKGNTLNTKENGREYYEEYEKMAKALKDGTETYGDSVKKRLPRINFDIVKTNSWKYEDIKLE